MITDKDIERLEQYLNGELNGRELESFKNEINHRTELKQELALHQGVREAVNDKDTLLLQETLKEIREEWKIENMSPPTIRFWHTTLFKVAAVIILVATVSLLLYLSQRPTFNRPYELYAHHYKPPTAELVRGFEERDQTKFQDALLKFNEANYQEAAIDFESMIASDPGHIKPQYYLAHCYMNLGNMNKAITLFHVIIDHADNIYILDARWYLGLAYLNQGLIDEARQQFLQLQKNTSKGKEVGKLLSQLESLEE